MANPWDPVWAQKAPPKPLWRWDVWGDNSMVINIPHNISFIKRIKSKLFLGSRWTPYK